MTQNAHVKGVYALYVCNATRYGVHGRKKLTHSQGGGAGGFVNGARRTTQLIYPAFFVVVV